MNRMVACLFGIGITLVLLSALVVGGPDSPTPTITVSVVDVVDGNTIVVNILAVSNVSPVFVGDTVHIRLIGIELTESGEAFWEANADMAIARTVYLAVDSTSAILWKGGDEPLSAYLYLDPEGKTLVNSMLIAMGFAEAVTSSMDTHKATSVTTSEVQAEASTTTMAAASTISAGVNSVRTPAQSTALTTVLAGPRGCCCCLCAYACPIPEPLNLLHLTSCVRRGDYAKLDLEAVPGTWYQIDVGYHSYLSTDLDLSPRTAFCGVVRWRWKVHLHSTWPITVIARLDGEIIGRLDTYITVRR
jgi:endonuclease YncB( thermonuclease family)